MAKEKKTRLSKQRQVIFEELQAHTDHPTATELYEEVRKQIPNISLGTVYRNLEVLTQHGLIREVEVSGTQKRFEKIKDDHYHVRCIQCGRVEDITYLICNKSEGVCCGGSSDDDRSCIANQEDIVAEHSGFKIVGHKLEFFGFCDQCASDDNQ